MIKTGDEVEVLISSEEFNFYVGQIALVIEVIVDKDNRPVLAVIQLDDQSIDDWNNASPYFPDDGKRNISLDHIRLPK